MRKKEAIKTMRTLTNGAVEEIRVGTVETVFRKTAGNTNIDSTVF
jgi:hypothetical protein